MSDFEKWISQVEAVSSKEDAEELVKRRALEDPDWWEPFFVGNLALVEEKYHIWKKELPDVELFYAVKSNDDPMVLKLLASLGSSFDCASKGEVDSILKLGVSPEKVMLSNPYKFPTHLKEAVQAGIRWMVCDSPCELFKIHQICPDAKLVIRIYPKDERTAYIPMSSKFGCDISEATIILKEAKDFNMTVKGLSFYVGHCTESPVPYKDAISLAREVFDIAKEIGHDITLIDIGGGFQGIPEKRPLFYQTTAVIRESLSSCFGSLNVRFIGEPGQFMCIEAFSLYAKVIGVRQRKTSKGQVQNVYVSGGHFGCIPNYCFKYNGTDVEFITKNPDTRKKLDSVIWGPTCDSMDQLTEMQLVRVRCGDCLKFTNMGSYVRSISSCYNGFPIAQTKYLISDKISERQKGEQA